MSTCLNHKQEDEALDALQILVELADVEPTFLRPHLTTVVNAMLTIANTKQLQDGIRQLGLEFLVTLAEQRAGMVRKVPNFVQNLVPVVLNFMLDIEEDPEWGTHDVRSLRLHRLLALFGVSISELISQLFRTTMMMRLTRTTTASVPSASTVWPFLLVLLPF